MTEDREELSHGYNKLQKELNLKNATPCSTDLLQHLFGIPHTNTFRTRHSLYPLTYNLPLVLSEML